MFKTKKPVAAPDITVLDIGPLQLTRSQILYLPVKRLMDIIGAFLALVMLLPLFIIVAIAIKLDSPGPIFFGQTRVGTGGKAFTMYKFRSMIKDADKLKDTLLDKDESEGPFFKIRKDPRITRVGRFIRKYSIDELPQFFNVLLGHISLVGPRPVLFREIISYKPEHLHNLAMKPGLTCYWQVGGRSDSTEDRFELDARYIAEFSLFTDLLLLIKTPIAVVKGEGAY